MATACLGGLPAFTSAATLALNALGDADFLRGMLLSVDDGKVNIGDLGPLNQAGKNFNMGIYDPTTDINGDNSINTIDANALIADIRAKLQDLV